MHGGDRAVIGVLGQTEEQAASATQGLSAAALTEIRSGRPYREANRAGETVSLFVPLKNFKGDVALYLRHEFATNYYKNLGR